MYTNPYGLDDVKHAKCGICESENSQALAHITETISKQEESEVLPWTQSAEEE